MQTLTHRLVATRGSTLLSVLGFLFISVGLVTTILSVSTSHGKIAHRQQAMEQAMYVAEAGVERGARHIESNIVTLANSTILTGSFANGTYKSIITRINPSTFSIVTTGTVRNVSRSVTIKRVYQPTYAEFALWSKQNGAIYFKNGETFNGHVHADDRLYFDVSGGGPVFNAPVTSGVGTYTVQGGSINDVTFNKGLELNSYQGTMADVDFNSGAASSLRSIAQSKGLVLEGNTTITFNGSSVRITNSRAGYNNYNYTPSAEGIIYIQNATSGTTSTRPGTVYLTGGNVAGRLTIVTETDIYIQGHIRYATDPRTNPNSTDALGLISRDDVFVDTMAPNNLEINAAIMATGTAASGDRGSFAVVNYNSGSPRGTLTVYGGIVQDQRGAVGTFNSSTGATSTGFAKDYSYDPRFIDNPPPYYPAIAGKVEFSEWREGR
jgi:hypothetical protein